VDKQTDTETNGQTCNHDLVLHQGLL